MSHVNNNAYEIDPSPRKKRKRDMQCTNAFMNPALDILSTEDRMCNNIMEVAPAKRSRRSKSCDSRVSFENPGLECGSSKISYSNDLLRKELANVNMKLASILEIRSPIYQNNSFNHITIEEKTIKRLKFEQVNNQQQVNSTPMVGAMPKRRASFDLSFIDKIGVDDSTNGEALYLDDDLNESNIMEIKTIDDQKLAKSPVILKSTNPFLNCQIDYDAIEDVPTNVFTNDVGVASNNFPFDIPVKKTDEEVDGQTSESSYNTSSEPEVTSITSLENPVVPRRLFPEHSDNSIQYMDDSSMMNDVPKFGHSTLNEQINTNFTKDNCKNDSVFVFGSDRVNKQSKILGCDVTNMSEKEIFNCRPNNINSKHISIPNINNNIQATFKDNSKRGETKQGKGKNSKNIFSKIKDVFKHNEKKSTQKAEPYNVNPYEVFRKAPVQEKSKKPLPVCFVNPALNLNTTDSEMDDGIVAPNNLKLTPMKKLKETYDKENYYSIENTGVDLSDLMQTENTIKKQVRFDSTLNHEKFITGNSFDSENHSVGSSASSIHITQVLHSIDDQIDDFHNELDNCFNEKKIISQNL